MRIGYFAVAVLAFAVSAASTARADVDTGKADAAFDEGQKAKDAGNIELACKKFRESLGFNPNAVGTMLNVALCESDAGHIGTALKLFTEARDRGREQNMGPYVHLAEQKIQEIGADVPYLNLVLVENTPDTKIVVNDQIVAVKADGTATLPVDPGLVSIIVSRPERVPFEKKLDIKKQAHETLRVDPLKHAVTISGGRKRAGQILTIGGGALAVTGVVLGIYANHDWNSQIKNCKNTPTGWLCPQDAFSATNQDHTLGTVGTAVGFGGLGLAAVGTYLWFFGPHDERLTFVPRLDPEHAGIVALGRF
jgi:hypothetical protein